MRPEDFWLPWRWLPELRYVPDPRRRWLWERAWREVGGAKWGCLLPAVFCPVIFAGAFLATRRGFFAGEPGFGLLVAFTMTAIFLAPLAALLLACLLTRRRLRRILAEDPRSGSSGRCLACGYDLRGSAAASHCPECGQPLRPQACG